MMASNNKLRLHGLRSERGFTIIELTMVIVLLSVLAAVAIPNYIDFRTDAKNSATQGGLGSMRAALAIGVAAIQLKEDPTTTPPPPRYPTYSEMSTNLYDSNHPVLNGNYIMDPSLGFPNNPWTKSTAAVSTRNRIYDCSAIAKAALLNAPNNDRGWCYNENTGELWANSDLNTGLITENNY